MFKTTLAVATLLASTVGYAADLNGDFQCDDGGTLSLKRSGLGHYYASLNYRDGSSSTLAEIMFMGESLRGKLLRDDGEETHMGYVIMSDGGSRLVLTFNGGGSVTCVKGSAPADSKSFRLYSEPHYKVGGFCDRYVSLKLKQTRSGQVAEMEDGLSGMCEIVVRPNPRSFTIRTVEDDGCGSTVYSGYRRDEAGDILKLTITDNSNRLCENIVAAPIVVQEETPRGLRRLYSAE
jgi:hypothetical protein